MVNQAPKKNSIKAIERATRIINALQKHEVLTLTALSDLLELPTSTAHVYLQTLVQEGFVVRDDEGYRNSLKFLEYGGNARRQYNVYEPARIVLRDLATHTGERAGLGVEERGKRVLLHLEDDSKSVNDNIPIGERTEMHWTGLGKCLLAHLSETRRNDIIEQSNLPKATQKTITDADDLIKELEQIRNQGYAIEDEERREGIRSAAVPVLTPENKILGAIGLTGPTSRFDEEQMSEYVHLLQQNANIIKLQTLY